MRYFVFILFLLIAIACIGQNLVPNGSFENVDHSVIDNISNIYNNFPGVKNWFGALGTPDAFNGNTTGPAAPWVGTPSNKNGYAYQVPFDGVGYAGIGVNHMAREYIECQLTTPLIAGKSYRFEMYVSLSDDINPEPNHLLEAMFTNDTLKQDFPSPFILITGTPGVKADKYITDKIDWTLVTGTYIASGGERFLTIGDFESPFSGPAPSIYGYYYIDGISLSQCPSLDHSLLGNDTTVCSNLSLNINYDVFSPDISSYRWSTGSTQPQVNVSVPGTYWVEIDKSGCKYYDTIRVTSAIVSTVDLGPDTLLCEGKLLRLNAFEAGATYQWQDGSTRSFYDVTQSGKYNVRVTQNGCPAIDSIQVTFVPKPQLDLGPDTGLCIFKPLLLDAFCSGVSNYLWNDGSTGPRLTVHAPGLYWAEIKRSVCTVRDSIQISIKPLPVVNLGPDRKICREDSLVLDAGSGNIFYKWENGVAQQWHMAKAPGIFYVTVISANTCEASDTIIIDTFPAPIVTLGEDTFLCEGNTIELLAGNGYNSYRWQDGSVNPFIRVTAQGSYYVTVKDQNGCSNSDTIEISPKNKPEVGLTSFIDACEPDFLLKPAQGFKSYQWQDGSTLPYFAVTGYGIYHVVVTDSSSCTNEASVEVRNYCRGKIFVPDAFTPNGDGSNETFVPVTFNITSLHLSIYNRWGQLVFETSELGKGWDGIYSNQTAQSDVYVYSISYVDITDTPGTLSGNITLLR